MKDTMGIIYAADTNIDHNELISYRVNCALPFGGKYRLIDFTLSNMTNSGISNVGIITQNNYSSLMNHVSYGREWNLDRKNYGLYILPPYISNKKIGLYNGSIDALHVNLNYIRKSSQKYVVFAGANIISNMTYDNALKYHIDRKADITLIYKEIDQTFYDESGKSSFITIDNSGRVKEIDTNPSDFSSGLLYMDMCIMEKDLLIELIEECAARLQSDFTDDILVKRLDNLKIYAYPYTGWFGSINSPVSYYKYSMELLKPNAVETLFYKPGRIFTKDYDDIPARYNETSKAKNSLISNGCIIKGDVTGSILFRGVKVGKGAHIKNCIIMDNSTIEENAVIEYAIIDKDAVIHEGKRLAGQPSKPLVIGKGKII